MHGEPPLSLLLLSIILFTEKNKLIHTKKNTERRERERWKTGKESKS